MSAIDILKLQLDDFFERSNQETHTSVINKEKKYFNKSLFELEKHLYDLKKQYNVNQDIDCSIASPNILDSFSKSPDFYRSDDYLLSFLVFLAIQKDHNADNLLECMDKYFDTVKDKLTFSDVITTATGATRCYTNLRFALNRLRNFGLVHSSVKINYDYSRSLLPTPFGYLLALYVSELKEEDVNRLLDNTYTKPSFNFYNLLLTFKKDTANFINKTLANALNEELTDLIESIRNSVMQIPSNIKFGVNYNPEDIEKTERDMKEYYMNDEKQQEISMRFRDTLTGI
jgi:hypothetical protein